MKPSTKIILGIILIGIGLAIAYSSTLFWDNEVKNLVGSLLLIFGSLIVGSGLVIIKNWEEERNG